jgi:uncharacterized protein (TIGR03000 family)
LVGLIASDHVNAYGRRYVAPQVGYSYYWSQPAYPYYAPYGISTPGYGYGYGYGNYNYGFAPLPAYGIMPAPLATMDMLYKDGFGQSQLPVVDPDVLFPPRARGSLYPAVPYEKSPEAKQADRRRVRFEITLPYGNSIVKFDDAPTKQTGVQRTFVTPPMPEDKQFTVTIEAQWPVEGGKMSVPRRKTFTVVAGQTVEYTFVE